MKPQGTSLGSLDENLPSAASEETAIKMNPTKSRRDGYPRDADNTYVWHRGPTDGTSYQHSI